MKKLFALFLFYTGSVFVATGQEIIPFPDLSENHIAVYNQAELTEDHNYNLYSKDYQDALNKIDHEIEMINNQIENEPQKNQRMSLQSEKVNLVKNRIRLIQEAELLEDLNKFY